LARYFLPSIDEWYKAAYYNPSGGIYYDYPTGSNSAPAAVTSGTVAGTAVYGLGGVSSPADITLAGGLSPYSTMAQEGNVDEWEETDFDLVNDSDSSLRGFRGGNRQDLSGELLATFRDSAPTTIEGSMGFRIASVIPEPSTLLLAAVAGMDPLWRRRR
jgi:hypothetical protein